MPLSSGTRLGPYEISLPLGAGGMGEVYRARDTKLGRDVAIKVLPPAFAADPDRRQRFEREARLLAALNHPNIAAIYGFEEHEGTRFLVLELVPGESLSARLSSGPLSVDESLSLAAQIARAIEYAHENGVIHRDLKPGNLLVTPGGNVKVLDFGLAKAFAAEAVSSNISQSPTLVSKDHTGGTILGTASYMSPEQARGKPVRKSSDIWSFGCVLFEMLTGRKAFGGESVSDALAAILTGEPDWAALPASTPPRVRDLLRRCLQKDVSQRLHDIGDARIEIEEARVPAAGLARPALSRRSRRVRVTVGVAAAAAVIAIAFGARSLFFRSSAIPGRKCLAVLPFRDLSGQPDGQLLGDGLVETVSVRLGKLAGLQVVTPAASVRAADLQPDPYRAAAAVGANLLLQGAVQRSGDRLRITYSVWNTRERTEVAGDTLDGDAADLFGIQDRLAERVSDALRLPVPGGAAIGRESLPTASQQERYVRAIGRLQRSDKPALVTEAIRLLQDLKIEAPDSPLVPAALGRAYLERFRDTHDRAWVDKAAGECARARALDPDSARADITLGKLRTLTGEPGEAIAAFRRALAREPDSYEALLGLAEAEAASGDGRGAEASFRRVIALQPAFWKGHSELGAFYYTRGQYALAAESFRRVTELTPDNSAAFGNLGAAEELAGDFPHGLEAFEKSLALEPNDAAYSNVGFVQFYLGNYRQAADAFEHAIALTPGHFEIWANLADAYRWMPGMRAKSEAAYARAIELAEGELRVNPQNGLAHSILALSLAKTGKLAQAGRHSERALQIDARRPEFLYSAAVVENLRGHSREATALLARAVDSGYSKAIILREPEFENLRDSLSFSKGGGS